MIRSERRNLIRTCALALITAMLLLPLGGVAQELPAAGERSQIVRVLLSRLGLTDRMDITLISPYTAATQEGVNMHFQAGSELALIFRDGALYLYYEGMSLLVGQSLTLKRDALEDQDESGFRLTNYSALYRGDLQLDMADGKLRPILSLHVEDYLLGVVPYEMSEAFPLEALKAQAVAARTYALRKQDASKAYDLVDTTNDQVFRGYLPGKSQTERAIRETRGVCGFYKGKLAQCYYAASNGGQTELVETVWPTAEDFGYYAFGDDPYDVENPASVVRAFEMKKTYAASENAPYALRKLLASRLADALEARGYDAAPESVRVDAIESVTTDTPENAQSKRMTMLHMTVRISGRTRREAPVEMIDSDTEEVSLFEVREPAEAPTASPAPTPAAEALAQDAAPTPQPTPEPTPEPIYGPFTAIEEAFTLDMPIFPDAESALSLDISGNYDNELWSVVESKTAYTVQARRFGHGVGMSQRGAQWMAGAYGKTYQEILAFYYPGLTLMRYAEEPLTLTRPEEALSATAGPAPSPTPRPTVMPLTQQPQADQWIALVTEIDDDSSLNLRETPDLNGNIQIRLYKNQRLLVLERCAEDGWVKVRTDMAEGYVMEKYLTPEES
ncbi:MAG: SpoIID/LytB domain-containing protein [Clostridiales bacterium]|nr:SpoIID/LytB domain-containing protein [Clostridiales bacterium]